jgi:mycothiol synthase
MNTAGVTVRPWQQTDQEAISDLRRATAQADVTDEGLVALEPPADPVSSGPSPQEDTLVVQDSEGRLLATAQLQVATGPQQSFLWSFPVVHPEWRGSSVEGLLLEGLWQMARERRSEIGNTRAHFYVHCGYHQRERIALYETVGLQLLRNRPHMAYHPLENLAHPPVPPGIQVRPYSRGQDDRSAVDTLNQAFADDWEFVPVTIEQWSLWLNSPQWRAELNLVASQGNQVVGLCLCVVNEERIEWLGRRDGYVDTLCVRPSFQRKGIGTALLLAALQALRTAGMVSASLDTDEDNPTQAARLYESVGFREIWTWAAYGLELR